MEWISQGFDRLVQSAVWRSVLSQAQWIDWLVLIAAILGLMQGIKKGFMTVLGDILQLMAVIVLTLEFEGKVSAILSTYAVFLPEAWMKTCGFAIAAIVFWWVVRFMSQFLAKIISAQTSSQLKVVGGGLCGVVYALLLLSFISQGILLSPLESLKTVYEKNASHTGFKLAHMAPKIHQLVIHPLQASGLSKKS